LEPVLPSFGENLKLERLKRKMTLEQISSSTKISTRMLQALEEEKFGQLPGGIFNKGFVRAYARTLGIDEDQAVADYLEASGDAPTVQIEPGLREVPRDSSTRAVPLRIIDDNSGRLEMRAEVASRQLPWGMFAAVLLIVALGLSIWSYHREQQKTTATAQSLRESRPASAENASPGGTAASSPSVSPNVIPNVVPANESLKSSSLPASSVPSSTPAQSASGNSSPGASSTVASMSKEPQPSSSSAPSSAPAPGEFVVVVQARDESWLSITVDGKHLEPQTLEAGDERTFRAVKSVLFHTGNAGGLDIRLNGKTLPVGGESGEVRTIKIGPSGLMPTADSRPAAVTQ
jgi:cytoskeleton protein RodZ